MIGPPRWNTLLRVPLRFPAGLDRPHSPRQAPNRRRAGVDGGLKIVCMAGVLRVDPKALRDAARSQTEVATFVSSMAVGESMTSAGAGVSDLHCASGCQAVADVLTAAATAAHEELSSHAGKMSKAADMYERADKELGDRLRKFVR